MLTPTTTGSRRLSVEPGSSSTFDIRLRNDGAAPETVRLRVTGPGGPFSFVVPDALTIPPGEEASVRIGFRAPRSSVPAAGDLAFQVMVRSGVAGATELPVADGIVEVQRFCSLSATIDPSEATVTGPSRHQVSVGNRGNAPVPIDLTAKSADGLDIRIEPTSVTASPDHSATATVEVTPPKRPFTGDDRQTSFTIVASPDVGSPVEVGARLRQRAAVAQRTLVGAGVVGVVVLALVLGITVFSGGSSSSKSATPAGTSQTVATGAPASSCPAAGHQDVFGANGQHPEDIPKLPNTYSFLNVKADGCNAVRFNPCEPIHYIQNLTLAPPTGAADVREAFNRLSQATGITFVDDGTTDENRRSRPYVPDRYPGRWAPILVNWQHFPNQGPDPAIQSVGGGIGTREGDILVSGLLTLNVDAVTNKDTRTPVQGGFGPPIGSGTGAIGPEGVTWGRIIIHELAHVIGLGHTRDKGAIMY
ncbi:MAG: hypothetical protein LC792_26570, partial [Actinobacteria bacterium]|nr:hypothetical protein [Actinomycetota bacterium]